MQRTWLFRIAIVAALAGLGCSERAIPARAKSKRPPVASADIAEISKAEAQFSLDLYAALRAERSGNLLISPLSLAQALAIAQAGARGETANQLAAVLQIKNAAPGRLHPAMGAMGAGLARRRPGSRLDVANALWIQSNYDVLADFVRTARDDYDAETFPSNFAQAAQVQQRIDDWVAKNTQGKIRSMPVTLDQSTQLVITNAVYFLGQWYIPFAPLNTSDMDFLAEGGRKVNVRMMHQMEHVDYAEDDSLQMLQLYYQGGDLAMVILLPRKPDGLAALEENLQRSLYKHLSRLKSRMVKVYLPRFRITDEFQLAGTIEKLGAPDAFNPKAADFSGIAATPLVISQIAQRTYIDVNEEGTEAAAATEEVMKEAMKVEPPPTFRADHPFLFLIRDTKHGAILFIGRLAEPQERPTGD